MTEQDFERDLQRAMAGPRAPEALQRWIASIPLDHARRPRESWMRRWFGVAAVPWTASLTAALASLAIGFWVGFADLTDAADAGNEELALLVFPSVPTSMGEEQ